MQWIPVLRLTITDKDEWDVNELNSVLLPIDSAAADDAGDASQQAGNKNELKQHAEGRGSEALRS